MHLYVAAWTTALLFMLNYLFRLNYLDRIFRSAARLVGRIPRYGHVSKFMLDDLHWLPLQQRIQFRLSCIAWRCVQALAPSYLCELFAVPATLGRRSLRSTTRRDIWVP